MDPKWTMKSKANQENLPIKIAESGPRTKSNDKGIKIQNAISLL